MLKELIWKLREGIAGVNNAIEILEQTGRPEEERALKKRGAFWIKISNEKLTELRDTLVKTLSKEEIEMLKEEFRNRKEESISGMKSVDPTPDPPDFYERLFNFGDDLD